MSNLLKEFQDIFIDDILAKMPLARDMDDHSIDLIPRSTPPNMPPYQASQAQQEEIMQHVDELVSKGMIRISSSLFCSLVL